MKSVFFAVFLMFAGCYSVEPVITGPSMSIPEDDRHTADYHIELTDFAYSDYDSCWNFVLDTIPDSAECIEVTVFLKTQEWFGHELSSEMEFTETVGHSVKFCGPYIGYGCHISLKWK